MDVKSILIAYENFCEDSTDVLEDMYDDMFKYSLGHITKAATERYDKMRAFYDVLVIGAQDEDERRHLVITLAEAADAMVAHLIAMKYRGSDKRPCWETLDPTIIDISSRLDAFLKEHGTKTPEPTPD